MSSESRYEILKIHTVTDDAYALFIRDNDTGDTVCDMYTISAKCTPCAENSLTRYQCDHKHAQIICDALNNHHLQQNKTFIGRIVHAFKSAWKELRS